MNIEQLGPDKIKVLLSSVDLDKYDLDYLSISSDSPGTRRMLEDILHEASEATGFSTHNCKLLIEVLPGKSAGCVLYLTKLPRDQQEKKPFAHETECENPSHSYILYCSCIDDAINAINRFALYPDIPLIRSTLYNCDGGYQLAFSPVRFGLDRARLSSLLADLSEYGQTVRATPVQEAVLSEHGSVIKGGRAVESFMRYFC